MNTSSPFLTPTLRRAIRAWVTVLIVVTLAACGSSSDSSGTTSPITSDSETGTVGMDGGMVISNGVNIVVPAGAMISDATIRVAKDSSGSPALPAWTEAIGEMVAITPHGSEFNEPVTVRLPMPSIELQENQRLMIAKAQPGGTWEVLGETVQKDGQLEVQVHSFSYFTAVVVTYLPPVALPGLILPFEISSLTLECDGAPCADPEFIRPMTITATVTNNGGGVPANCVNPQIVLRNLAPIGSYDIAQIDAATGSVARRDFPMPVNFSALLHTRSLTVGAILRCTDTITNVTSNLSSREATTWLVTGLNFTSVPHVVQFPAALTQAVGDTPTVRAIFTGGASLFIPSSSGYRGPTASDQPTIYLERLAAGDSAWRTVATSLQTVANPTPFGDGPQWLYWSFDYTLGPLSLTDNGSVYRMRACYKRPADTEMFCTSGPTALMTVVQQVQAPSVSQQPHAVLINPGQTASFSVVASGVPAPTLRWQSRTANSTSGSGDTTPNYTSPVVTLADNGMQYRVLATNSTTSTASQTVTVSVAESFVSPTIVAQPTSLTVVTGSEALFAVTASGTGALSYQWHKGGHPIAGGNSPQLRIANASASDKGSYSVHISNAVGYVNSDIVSLDVIDGTPAAAIAPTIVTQPAAVAVTEGNVATFAVGVSGSGPLSFQWRKNSVDITGATAAAYTLPAVAMSDAGNYNVRVINSVGDLISQSATLAVSAVATQPAPAEAATIITQPGSIVVTPGMSAMFGVAVQGSGPFSFVWLHDGVPVMGETQAIFEIATAAASDAGMYQVQISNSVGTVTSAASQVILLGAPAIATQPVDASVVEGNTATFSVTASGDALHYQWLLNGVVISGAVGASYTTPVTTLADNGAVFTVLVFNGANDLFSQGAVLTVSAAPPSGGLTLVTNSGANTLAILRADATTGALTTLGTTGTGEYPYGVAITPNGLFAYVSNLAGNSLSSYSVNSTTGAVTMVGTSVSSANPYGIAMDPLGRFVWAVNCSTSKVSAYAINGAMGQLTAAGAPVATGSYPYGVAAHPSGNYLYVANEFGNSVSAYSVNASTDVLTLLGGTIANSVNRPHSIAIDPSGKFVYVTESGGSSVAAFSINASTGVLSLVGYANTEASPSSVAVHPNGQFVYVANQDSNSVSVFAINNSTGALTAGGLPIATGSGPAALAISGSGSFLYVANLGGNSTSAYSINANTGVLTSLGATVATGSGPLGIATTP